jgi:flavodoxin
MKAVIIYNSKTGTTKKYAETIGEYLKANKMEVALSSIREYKDEILEESDYLLLGCWTQGLILFLQHPEKVWVDFVKILPVNLKSRIILFTTYKVLTGSMFKKMYTHLNDNYNFSFIELKSRNGSLSAVDKISLDKLVDEAA